VHSVVDRVFPARFADRTLAGYVPATKSQEEALAAAHRLASGDYLSLVLVGPPGVGKTHLAAGVVRAIVLIQDADYTSARDAMKDGDPWPRVPTSPMWTNVADLIVSLRMQMDAPLDDRDATAAVRILRRHPALVVLDDLGREKASDWTGELVYALVNARYENRLPTLVTSNLSPAELAASPYWPAISRLAEDGALVRIEAPDHRLVR
jgi:DNA replication protein DnaC